MQSKNTKQLKEAFKSWRSYTSINEEKDYTPGPGEEKQYTEGPIETGENFDSMTVLSLFIPAAKQKPKFLYKITPELFGLSKITNEEKSNPQPPIARILKTSNGKLANINKDGTKADFLKINSNNTDIIELKSAILFLKRINVSNMMTTTGKDELGKSIKIPLNSQQKQFAQKAINDLISELTEQQSKDENFLDFATRIASEFFLDTVPDYASSAVDAAVAGAETAVDAGSDALEGDFSSFEKAAEKALEKFKVVAASFFAVGISYVGIRRVFSNFFSDERVRQRIGQRGRRRSQYLGLKRKPGILRGRRSGLSNLTSVADLAEQLNDRFFERTTDTIISARLVGGDVNSNLRAKFELMDPDSVEARRISGRRASMRHPLDVMRNFIAKEFGFEEINPRDIDNPFSRQTAGDTRLGRPTSADPVPGEQRALDPTAQRQLRGPDGRMVPRSDLVRDINGRLVYPDDENYIDPRTRKAYERSTFIVDPFRLEGEPDADGRYPGGIGPSGYDHQQTVDRVGQQLRDPQKSLEFENNMADTEKLKQDLDTKVNRLETQLNPDNRPDNPLPPRERQRLQRQLDLARDKAAFVQEFIKDVKEFARLSAGRSLKAKDGIKLLGMPFTKLRSLAKYAARKSIKLLNKFRIGGGVAAIFKYSMYAITAIAVLDTKSRIEAYIGEIGDDAILAIINALGNVPGLDELAIVYLEEKALKAQQKMKGARFILENANLDDMEELIVASIATYYTKNWDQLTSLQKELNNKQRPVYKKPGKSTDSTDVGPAPNLGDLLNENNKKLKITLGAINESKKLSNNKILKITIS